MNKSILITGANAGLGKEAARQAALNPDTEKVILACRNPQKAEKAKAELEAQTGRNIFEILIMDVSDAASVRKAVASLDEPVDAFIMNAGGIGGRDAGSRHRSGMNNLSATNLLGHVVLIDEALKANKLRKVAALVSSEAARGIPKMGMDRPVLRDNSVEEMEAVLNGSYFGEKFNSMAAYGYVKYVGTLWMSSMARQYPNIKFVSVSPGATSGTEGVNDAPPAIKFMFKYIMMPIVMPLRGMVHKVDKGAKRFLDVISDDAFKSGAFYASEETKVTGHLVDQAPLFPYFTNPQFQDNAHAAIHRYI